MKIVKRDKMIVDFDVNKIKNAILKAEVSEEKISEAHLDLIINDLLAQVSEMSSFSVEQIQDMVEKLLMQHSYYEVAKSYILYRDRRNVLRGYVIEITNNFEVKDDIYKCLTKINKDYHNEEYICGNLLEKFRLFIKPNLNDEELLNLLIKAAVESITQERPCFEFVAARLLLVKHARNMNKKVKALNLESFYEKVIYMTNNNLYGAYILEHYTKEEIEEAYTFINNDNNYLFNYSGLDLLLNRYLIKDYDNQAVEDIQEMYLGIALHLAMKEQDKLSHVKNFYEILSSLKITLATPTLSNSRKPYHQLSSCFIDTVEDSLEGIYRSIDSFAKVSKLGGGMGLYFGKVRSIGGSIRGFKGVAGGVIRWIKLVNDTAVAVDQLGVRQGAVAVYLDAWHKDLPEFLNLRTNNGDDRMKAHDIFPALCYPDLFWKMVKSDINADWHLMCPHEIKLVKGYSLEDSFGDEWEVKYLDCVNDERISKRVISLKELVRQIIKSAVETGTPFVFNRDIVNKANPNKHEGIIYCSNLCTEIAQNMSANTTESTEITEVNGESIVVTKVKAGDFVVCNLASLTLGRIDVHNDDELKHVVTTTTRMLDNVIDLNYYPLPYAKITNHKYRAIGLGISGYHHLLALNKISFESDEHLSFMDELFERINYHTINASKDLAIEKGSYSLFENSEWQNGKYFERRNYNSDKWLKLKDEVSSNGLRNGYLLAVAPTSSTSILAGSTAGVDPIMNKFFLEEKKNGLIPRLAPSLSQETYWLYKNAHLIDQNWVIKAGGIRQRHIDQAQSMNLYITNEFTFRQILNLYISAYEHQLKTIYYVRSKSLDIEECESCSA